MRMMRTQRWIYPALLICLALVGCRPDTLPNPTVIPTVTITITATVPPTLSISNTPAPPSATFLPIVTATIAPTPISAVLSVPSVEPTLAALCVTAQANDTITTLLYHAGYGDLSAAPAFRILNKMPPNSNVIQVGQTYCIPRPTQTPTPPGGELTQTAQAPLLPTSGAATYLDYVIKAGDSAGSIEANTGVALSLICKLNPAPSGINCAGCDLNAPIFQAKCRPILVVNNHLRLPGPTPTPTITPTLTGSETATPLPAYDAPIPLSPVDGQAVSGPQRLEWLPIAGILQPDQTYMVLMTDATVEGNPRNAQLTTQATSLLIPADFMPQDGAPHTIHWLVGVAQIGADGSAILISPKSAPMTFTWTKLAP